MIQATNPPDSAPAAPGAARSPGTENRFLGLRITPITRRRLDNFRRNRRGFWSLWIFLALFFVTLFAEVIANDKPLLIRYDGAFYAPVLFVYPETTFGGEFLTEADYRDEFVAKLIDGKVHMKANYGLSPEEVAQGYILTCQAVPLTDNVAVDYDA